MKSLTEFHNTDKNYLQKIINQFLTDRIITEMDTLLLMSLFRKLGQWMEHTGYQGELFTSGKFYKRHGAMHVLYDADYFDHAEALAFLDKRIKEMENEGC